MVVKVLEQTCISEELSFVDLFCGGGGAARGYTLAGFSPILGIDVDHYALSTYRENFPKTQIMNEDIAQLRGEDVLRKTRIEHVPLVIASPPCEPYTSANVSRMKRPEDRLYEDPKGQLMLHAIRLIGDLQPDIFVIENVVPAISGELGVILREELAYQGYAKIHYNVIEAHHHGVPSIRRRVFISNKRLSLPKKRPPRILEAIEDLPDPRYPHGINGHEFVPLPAKYEETIYKVQQGQSLVFFRGAHEEFNNYTRLRGNEIAPTVMGKSRFIHPLDDRLLTPREHARLMSYPDSHALIGGSSEQFNIVGESVPPLLTKMMGEFFKKEFNQPIF